MSEDHNDDMPEEANFFSKQAKFRPKISAEELEASLEFLYEIHEENNDTPPTEDIRCAPAKQAKRKASEMDEYADWAAFNRDWPSDNVPTVPDVYSTISLSAAAESHLKKRKVEHQMESKSTEVANQKVPSSINTSDDDIEYVDVIDSGKKKHLAISYLSQISLFSCYENDKFSIIISEIARLFKLKVSEFVLFLKGRNIEADDTPKSLNIADSDILEIIPNKATGKTKAAYGADKIKASVQSSDDRKQMKKLNRMVKKVQDIKVCLEDVKITLAQLQFDVEQLPGSATPDDTDSESSIEVSVLTEDENAPEERNDDFNIEFILEKVDESNFEENDDVDSDDSVIILNSTI